MSHTWYPLKLPWITYFPMNARSELMPPTNWVDGGVLETRRRFQMASPASVFPPLRPTRGSGLGALVDVLLGDGAPPRDEEVFWEQALKATRARRSKGAVNLVDTIRGSWLRALIIGDWRLKTSD